MITDDKIFIKENNIISEILKYEYVLPYMIDQKYLNEYIKLDRIPIFSQYQDNRYGKQRLLTFVNCIPKDDSSCKLWKHAVCIEFVKGNHLIHFSFANRVNEIWIKYNIDPNQNLWDRPYDPADECIYKSYTNTYSKSITDILRIAKELDYSEIKKKCGIELSFNEFETLFEDVKKLTTENNIIFDTIVSIDN